jgi:hypothetical protein
LKDEKEEKGDSQPRVALFYLPLTAVYHTPLSLPVILKATAAAEASGGSKLKRNVAGTFPRNAACVICCV